MKPLFPLIFILFVLAACQSNRPRDLSAEETAEYMEKGKSIVQESFKALSGQLAAAMNEGGVQHAVSYCNINANPIMDSLSEAHHVTISRVTLRPRNQDNLCNAHDSEILKDYLRLQSEQRPLHPFVETLETDVITYYSPITVISPLCLKCHGTPEIDVSTEDYGLITSLYPDDQATGYSLNELRGMWKVEFH